MEIQIRKFASASFTTIAYIFHVKSREQFNADLMVPVIVDSMPLESKESAVLTNFQGNTMTLMLEWIIADSDTTVVDGLDIKTAQEQFNFLLNTYEPVGLDDAFFELEIMGVSPQFKKQGIITNLKMNQTKSEPITYRATLLMTVGKSVQAID